MVRKNPEQIPIQGSVSADFQKVKEEFTRNFTERGDLGAACAIYHRGEKVVDLWGGYRTVDARKPWAEDTLVLVFSTTKGLAAMALAVAHSQGMFEFDDAIADHWPEFAAEGKSEITIRQLLAHQAGLPALDQRVDSRILGDLDRLAEIIARQKPAWRPGTRHGYHTLSLGWYQNELIRRVDPTHRSLGQFYQEEIARPLGIESYIGLPRDISDERVAEIKSFHPIRMLFQLHTMPTGMILSAVSPWSLTGRSIRNPKLRRAGDLGGPMYRHLEIPAANSISQVRAIARAYSAFAGTGSALRIAPGTVNGRGSPASDLHIAAGTLEELSSPAREPSGGSSDVILKTDASYSHGFIRPCQGFLFGSSPRAFGCPGAGGSFAFADPDEELGYAYAGNRMGFYLFDDPREKALRDACYACLAAMKGTKRQVQPRRQAA